MVVEIPLLSGIARRTLDALMRNPIRTVEIRNARNYMTLEKVKEGDLVFLTYESLEDVMRGTEGIIAMVTRMEKSHQRVPWEESDEREISICRVQLKLVGLGRVVEVQEKNGVVFVKVREMLHHEISMG
ncbi:DUF473 domain-containing protein [Pyrococcus furiosus DSM 3638]|uniref:DUF473 domain-containing protein n=3 Tax=Pyrococcus furiosus TaxID=2261 RepID=Q8U4R0_PYRFU|nr:MULTISPECIES: DUF473 family protein [Pyrococcus]AAL80138.1 hypothetical protein PF0014 [Pyrococcus furiosus DSM 3638]AFN04561.1 hypothetical protein PFC_08145 [Pyrococcus furiosus COM1]MDK2869155.1 uncharacterized protein [Pyrococcus sp.]QEK79669.1 DUF473 domain-containing protein [Pyrococcus furiosus DSM 3638]